MISTGYRSIVLLSCFLLPETHGRISDGFGMSQWRPLCDLSRAVQSTAWVPRIGIRGMGKEDLEEALPDEDDEGDDYDRDEDDFDGDYNGSEDYDVFGKYVKSAQIENGKPVFLGPKTEGSRPSIAFTTAADGKPTWWVCDASGGECFYAESDSDLPPRSTGQFSRMFSSGLQKLQRAKLKKGWRKEYSEDELEVVLEACEARR
eukprot:Skav223105  [mRNA]  locus=scaffold419:710131:712872:+ [translate_table: standard]